MLVTYSITMPASTVWKHAFIRLGATEDVAEQMIGMMRSMAVSRHAFRQWDRKLPPQAERPLIKAIDGPDGERIAAGILMDFRNRMMEHFNISEEEVEGKLKGIGFS